MLFSERQRLAEEYEAWRIQESAKLRGAPETQIADCPESVIVFLQQRNLLRDSTDAELFQAAKMALARIESDIETPKLKTREGNLLRELLGRRGESL